jgi:CubicO group peptidase (beta-lactamase class C family)
MGEGAVPDAIERAVPDAIEQALELAHERGEVGVQVAAYLGDQLIVDVWSGTADLVTGRPVSADTMFPVFSTTKAITVTALHIQAERGLVDYGERVATYWPEYAANGKGATTVRDALTHRAGIPQMPGGVTPELMCDWEWMVEHVAALEPLYEPGATSAYHALVFGWLIGEIVRRTDPGRRPFGQFVREEICEPLGIEDLWLGVPSDAIPRVAVLSADVDEPIAWSEPRARSTMPRAVSPTATVHNRHDIWQACDPGAGGIMSARAAARFFAMLANGGELDGVRLLSEDHVRALTRRRDRPEELDAIMMGGGVYAPPIGVGGFWLEHPVADHGPHVLLHGGAGGSIGWANLDTGLGAAICHNRMFDDFATDLEHHPLIPLGDAVRTVARTH